MTVATAKPVATASTRIDVLLDPELSETALDVLTGVAQISAARPLRCSAGAILGAVHPGAVVVLRNPTAAIVEILVAWGGIVMAVRDDRGARYDRGTRYDKGTRYDREPGTTREPGTKRGRVTGAATSPVGWSMSWTPVPVPRSSVPTPTRSR